MNALRLSPVKDFFRRFLFEAFCKAREESGYLVGQVLKDAAGRIRVVREKTLAKLVQNRLAEEDARTDFMGEKG